MRKAVSVLAVLVASGLFFFTLGLEDASAQPSIEQDMQRISQLQNNGESKWSAPGSFSSLPERPAPPSSINTPRPVRPPSSVNPPRPVRPPSSVNPPRPVRPPSSVNPPRPVRPPSSVNPPRPVRPPSSVNPPRPVRPPSSVRPPRPVRPPSPVRPPVDRSPVNRPIEDSELNEAAVEYLAGELGVDPEDIEVLGALDVTPKNLVGAQHAEVTLLVDGKKYTVGTTKTVRPGTEWRNFDINSESFHSGMEPTRVYGTEVDLKNFKESVLESGGCLSDYEFIDLAEVDSGWGEGDIVLGGAAAVDNDGNVHGVSDEDLNGAARISGANREETKKQSQEYLEERAEIEAQRQEELAALEEDMKKAIEAIEEEYGDKIENIEKEIETIISGMEEALDELRKEFISDLLSAISEGRLGDLGDIIRDYRNDRKAMQDAADEAVAELEDQASALEEARDEAISTAKEAFSEEADAINEMYNSKIKNLLADRVPNIPTQGHVDDINEMKDTYQEEKAELESQKQEEIGALEEDMQEAIEALEEEYGAQLDALKQEMDALIEGLDPALAELRKEFISDLLDAVKSGNLTGIPGIIRDYLNDRKDIRDAVNEEISNLETKIAETTSDMEAAVKAVKESFEEEAAAVEAKYEDKAAELLAGDQEQAKEYWEDNFGDREIPENVLNPEEETSLRHLVISRKDPDIEYTGRWIPPEGAATAVMTPWVNTKTGEVVVKNSGGWTPPSADWEVDWSARP